MSEQPPQPTGDVEAEKRLIGAMLRDSAFAPTVVTRLPGREVFTDFRLAEAYDAIVNLVKANRGVSVTAVRQSMKQAGDNAPDLAAWLEDLGGQMLPMQEDVEAAMDVVIDAYTKQRTISVLVEKLAYARNQATSGEEAAAAAASIGLNLVSNLSGPDLLRSGVDVGDELMADLASPLDLTAGAPSGLKSVDEVTRRFRPGQCIVVGARTSEGKSVMAVDIMRGTLNEGKGVLFFALEMTSKEVLGRLWSNAAGVSADHFRDHTLTEKDWDRIDRAIPSLNLHNLSLVDDASLTMEKIVALSMRQVLMWKAAGVEPGVIIIDFLQQMQHPKKHARHEELGETMRATKALAKAQQVPVVMVSQIGRASVASLDKTPSLHHLAASGDIETNADTALLLFRPSSYDDEARPGEVDIIIAKNRNGERATVTVAEQFEMNRFRDLARQSLQP